MTKSLAERARQYYQQLAPHVADREGAKLLDELGQALARRDVLLQEAKAWLQTCGESGTEARYPDGKQTENSINQLDLVARIERELSASSAEMKVQEE